ncbi:MAG TPA: hypothetical protein VIJ34_10340 [Acidimicrobiales bacterium]
MNASVLSYSRLAERYRIRLDAKSLGIQKPATRAGTVTLIVGLGLCIQAVGYAIARSGNVSFGLDLFFAGVVVIFAPCAWRLLGVAAERTERLQVASLLGVALAVSFYLVSPLFFNTFDEMLHDTTYWQLLDLRKLFATNTELTISPYYPGLEMLTVAVRWGTGLPAVASQAVVVLACRLVLVLAFFLFSERVLHSARAAGIAVLVYACGPQFYAFNAAYSYQTIAIAFGAAAIYFLLLAGDGVHARRWTVLSVLAVVGATLSHHLVGALTVGLFCAWAIAISLESRQRLELRSRASLVRRVAGISVIVTGGWTLVASRKLYLYLEPIFVQAWRSIESVVVGSSSSRTLFQSSNGTTTPHWQQALLVLSILVTCVVGALAAWKALFGDSLRRGAQRFLPIIVTAAYVVVLVSPLTAASAQIGQRASTFIFFGLGILVGGWYLTWKRRPPIVVLTTIATACFVGSLIFGSGPSWSYVPGPYLPAADQRSVDTPGIAVAQWAGMQLPVESRDASDVDTSVLMAAMGHLSSVSETAALINPGLIFFSTYFSSYDMQEIQKYDIRYIVVDRRLLEGPPAFGQYFEPGTPSPGQINRVTAADLDKFGTASGLQLVYDNGPIKVYNTAALLRTTTAPTTVAPFGNSEDNVNLWVLIPALLALFSWLAKARRRRYYPVVEDVLGAIVAAMSIGVVAMFGFVPSKLDPTPIAASLLIATAFFAWRGDTMTLLRRARQALTPSVRSRSIKAPKPRVRRPQLWLGSSGALACLLAVVIAVISARTYFVPVTSLSIVTSSTQAPVAEVSLASPPAAAKLVLIDGGEILGSYPLRRVSSQSVTLPRSAGADSDQVELVIGGHEVREITA